MHHRGQPAVLIQTCLHLSIDQIRFRRCHGHSHQPAGASRNDEGKAAFLLIRKISDRRVVVGGVKDEEPAKFGVGNDGRRLRFIADPDCNYAVVELMRRSPLCSHIFGIARINPHRISGNVQDPQHGAHQVRFVFTIPIRLGKHLARRMRTHAAAAADTDIDRNIFDGLNIPAYGTNFIQFGLAVGGDLSNPGS